MNRYAIVAAVASMSTVAHAGPADYVYTPTVEYGEREIDFKFGSQNNRHEPGESAASVGLGWGVKPWWFTELYVKYKRENREGTKYDAVEWENKFQLTETGQYPVDLGFLVEIERPKDHAEGWEVKWGPLLQTEFGRIQFNGNLLFERQYRSDAAAETEFQYQWQAKYRWRPELEFGLQGFGEMGKWNDWAPSGERIHKIGPAVFGKLKLAGGDAIRYNAAVLARASSAAPSSTIRLQIEYEFK